MPSKLVRDKIPDIQRAEGLTPVVTVDRSLGPLLAKLREEAAELEVAVAGGDRNAVIEEAADLCEVWEAIRDEILATHGVHLLDLVRGQRIKREAKGGFAAGYILHDGAVPRRLAYQPQVAADVAALKSLLLEHGFEASDGDIALAYADFSDTEYGVVWVELDRHLDNPRYGPDYVVSELMASLTEVPPC